MSDGLAELSVHALVHLEMRTLTASVPRRKGTQQPCCIQLQGPQALWLALQVLCCTNQSVERKLAMGLESAIN